MTPPLLFSLKALGSSLQSRLMFLAGACVIASIWSLVALSSNAFQKDLERQILEQQSVTLTVLAAEIDQEIRGRMRMLESVAARITPAMLANPADAQAFLNDRLHMPEQFSGGHYVVNASAGLVASVPQALVKIGLTYQPDEAMRSELSAGKSVISKAVHGNLLKTRGFGIASPVRDGKGKTIGALVGAMDLSSTSFLSRITASVPNSMVRYRLISVRYRQIVTATDPILNLQELPAPGADKVLDQLLEGRIISTRRTDANGLETLVSAVKILTPDWLLVAELPVDDAFSASSQVKTQVWLWGLLITALALLLNKWFIHRQLAPITIASGALAEMTRGSITWRRLPMPIRKDEVGRLIAGFNELLTQLHEHDTELQNSEFRWKFAIEGAGDGVWDFNLAEGHVYYSRRWKEVLGLNDFEVGNSVGEWEDRLHPDDKARTLAAFEDYIKGTRPKYFDVHRLRHKDGSYRWILDRGMVVQRSAKGVPLRVIGTHTDVTERKESEEALRTLALGLEEAQRIARVGSWELNLVTNELKWSAQIFRLFEVDPRQFNATYEAFLDTVHPDDREAVNQAYVRSLEFQSEYEIVHRLLMPDGRIKWVRERGTSDFDEQGKALRSRGTVQDITESHLKDQAIEASRDLLMTIINTVPTRVFWKDLDLRFMGCNQPFAEDAGKKSPAEVIDRDDYDLACSAQADVYRADDFKVLQSGQAKLNYEEPQNTPDGKTVWLRTSKVPLRDSEGEIFGILGAYEDITARKATEIDLNRHRENLELLVQEKTSELQLSVLGTKQALELLKQQKFVLEEHAIVTMTDMVGRITYANKKFNEISGYGPEEFLGRDHYFLSSGHHPKGFFKQMFETVAQGGTWHAEVCNRRKDGTLFWVDTTVAAFRGIEGRQTEYIAIRTDITERKKAEQAAISANRAKSEFLANMSQEIRTPMNGVIGMVDLLQRTALTNDQRRMLRTINDSSLALLGILNDILDISKIEADQLQLERTPTQLRSLVESTVVLLCSMGHNKKTLVSLYIDPALPPWVLSDPARLRQILFNLLGNSLKFLDKGQSQVKVEVLKTCSAAGEAQAELRVIDNGIGMDQALQSRLFQPFTQADASTARNYGGTGLGLSITDRLVKMLGGNIQVQSVPGLGTSFIVQLPLQAVDAPARSDFALPDLQGVQVVAVTESDDTARLLRSYLNSVGVKVTCVHHLGNARALTETNGQAVLLLDWTDTPAIDAKPEALPGWTSHLQIACLIHRKRTGNDLPMPCIPAYPLFLTDLILGVAKAAGKLGESDAALTHLPTDAIVERQAPTAQEALQTGHLVLVAEDNEINREVLQEQLNRLGYVCELASDGEQALEMWRTGRYALLLTDCHMPKIDGFELTSCIRREEPLGTRTPILAITANAMEGEAQRGLAMGMDAYLPKPLTMQALQSALNQWLPLPPQIPQEELATELPVWDSTTLPNLVGKRPALHQQLLRKFLHQAHEHMTALRLAADTQDLSVLKSKAHTLKSAARSVGALNFGEQCQVVESLVDSDDLHRCLTLIPALDKAFKQAVIAIEHFLAEERPPFA